MPDGGMTLEARLEQLQRQEAFSPTAEFRASAVLKDASDHEFAERDPEGFWADQAGKLDWERRWDTVLDWSNPPFARWFDGGRLNVSYNCLDRHVEAGLGDRVAFHWRGEDGSERDVTYADLLRDVSRFANALTGIGVEPGDVVGIYLPMIPEVVVAMLACARIGAPHNVVFGGFSPESVRERMEFSDAKVLITADGARRKGRTAAVKAGIDEVIGDLASLQRVVVVRTAGVEAPMREGRDFFYEDLIAEADEHCPPRAFDAEHPLFILYTSGSTAKPKGILHTSGGYLTQVAYTHRVVFDLHPESDVYWCSADVGWITGHSYIVYGPLANGATSVMYEGAPDYPGRDIWWELVDRYKVSIFYTAPTAIRAAMKWGAEFPERHDLSSLRLLGSVGEPINPKAWLWYREVIGSGRCPIVDTWWQTETGALMIAPLPGVTDCKPGSAMQPLPGVDAAVLDESGEDAGEGQGYLVLRRPWPSMLRNLYREPERFIETYWSKYGRDVYFVGDAARRDADGSFWVIGRVDDVINVSGHRLSTAEVESAIVSHERVAEAAVIGQADEDTGQAITAFVTLQGRQDGGDALTEDIREHVARRIGKLARPKRIIWADDLPKTRSGKIMRRLLRDIAEGRELGDVTTLRDPDVMAELGARVAQREAEGGE